MKDFEGKAPEGSPAAGVPTWLGSWANPAWVLSPWHPAFVSASFEKGNRAA